MRRRGFTLIELMVVMWALGAAVAVGCVLLLTTTKVERVSAGALQRIAQTGQLAEQFRDDVARATDLPESFGEFHRGKECLILRQAGETRVVYEWAGGKLLRITRTGDVETRRPVAVVPDAAVEFEQSGGLVTLRVRETPQREAAWTWEIAAALGGDVR